MTIRPTLKTDTRIAVVELADAEPIEHTSSGGRVTRFIPRRVEIKMDLYADFAHRVVSVRVEGPALTKTGREHATQSNGWHWRYEKTFGPRAGEVWPPENTPEAALVAVHHARSIAP
jgi:hypothetical protein